MGNYYKIIAILIKLELGRHAWDDDACSINVCSRYNG